MNKKIDLKDCPFCFDQIPAAARKCKKCGEWQSDKERRRVYIAIGVFAFAALLFDTYTYERAKETNRSIGSIDSKKTNIAIDKASDFFLTSVKEVRRTDDLYIVGSVSNVSNFNIEGVVISVSYYDEKNQLIDQSRNYLGDLHKEDTKDFKVSFKCCTDNQKMDFSKHKRYDFRIEDAYYYSQ